MELLGQDAQPFDRFSINGNTFSAALFHSLKLRLPGQQDGVVGIDGGSTLDFFQERFQSALELRPADEAVGIDGHHHMADIEVCIFLEDAQPE